MQATRVKVNPPRWDSTKVELWPTFATDFESFVEYAGGHRLVELLNATAVSETLIPARSRSQTAERSVQGVPDDSDEAPPEDAPIQDRSELTPEERSMDVQFYHLLKLSITGPGHDAILHVGEKSFITAFGILRKEHGAANCLRKSALIQQLFDLTYQGQINEFKQQALSLLRLVFEAKVDLEDIIMACLLNAFEGDEFQAFKLMTAKQIDEGERINLYDHIQSIANSVELSQQSKARSTSLRVTGEPSCTRCGRSNHAKNQCFAKSHVDGAKLTDRPPSQAPDPRPRGGKGKDKRRKSGGKLSDLLRNLNGGDGNKLSLDQVKNAVARATSLRVSATPISQSNSTSRTVQVEPSPNHPPEPPEPAVNQAPAESSLGELQRLLGLAPEPAGVTPAAPCNRTVVLDSGSAAHLSANSSVTNSKSLTLVRGFDGQGSVLSKGKGRLDLTVTDDQGADFLFKVSDVDCMDNLPDDILSLAKIVQDGYSFIATPTEALLLAPDGTHVPVPIQDGIFVLECRDRSQACLVRSSQQRVDWQRIHSRLCHASHQAIIDTLNNTYGLSLDAAELRDFFCPVCALTKSARQRIGSARNPDTQATQPFERFYTDIKSFPDGAVSRKGYRYYIIYVCAYSDWITIYGLRRKSDAASTVPALYQLLGLQKLKYKTTIISDGDGAYGSPFTLACTAAGLTHDFTPPYTPQHNKAERAILRIDSMARTALVDAPHMDFGPYYFDCSESCTYVHNRIVGSRGKTPYELVKKQQPPIKHLVPFGCLGFLHVDKVAQKQRAALPAGHRAQQVHMLGYRSPFSNQWKVEVQDSPRRVAHSIHVDWNELDHGLAKLLSADHLEAILEEAGFEAPPELSGRSPEPPADSSALQEFPNRENQSRQRDSSPNQESPPDSVAESPPASPVLTEHSPQKGNSGSDSGSPAPGDLSSEAEDSPAPAYYGHNNSIAELNPDNILDTGRRSCNHTTVIHTASTHRVIREMTMPEALASDSAPDWLDAIDKEMEAILSGTAQLIPEAHPLYDDAVKTATRSRICLTEKRDGRKKARWIVQGCFEDRTHDDFSHYAHVASLTTFRSLCFRHDRKLRTMGAIDITTAFLQSDPYDTSEPQRFIKLKDPRTGVLRYYLLLTPMYGQRSAPVRWENTIAPWLISEGLVRGENEPCAFYRKSDDLTVLLYVDDLIADGDAAVVEAFFNSLSKRFKTTKPVYLSQDTPIDYLGVIISLDDDHITLSMEAYHHKLLANMDMTAAKPVGTPITHQICESELLSESEASRYRSGVGGIGWLANTVRPDLAFAFSRLGQHLAKPTVSAMAALTHCLKYVSGTVTSGLQMNLKFSDYDKNQFDFFSDSDHGGNTEVQNARRSQGCYLARQNGVAVRWASTAQSITTISSTEAEIYAASNAVQAFMHLGYVISELGLQDYPRPFQLYIDNNAAIIFMENTGGVSRLKHIDCRLNWVLQMRDRKIVLPCSVASAENLADIGTKILAGPTFRGLATNFMMLRF
jgi:hypothetical protein